MPLDTIIPVLTSCALLWWIGRRMSWMTRLVVVVLTLVVIAAIVVFERYGLHRGPGLN